MNFCNYVTVYFFPENAMVRHHHPQKKRLMSKSLLSLHFSNTPIIAEKVTKASFQKSFYCWLSTVRGFAKMELSTHLARRFLHTLLLTGVLSHEY